MQALILCGGKGKRLAPLTKKTPKPMIPINRKPFLEHQLVFLKKKGIKDFVFCAGYKWKSIFNYFKDGSRWGVHIVYSVEKKPLDTGGAVRMARGYLKDSFLVLYGDSFLPIDYISFYIKAKEMNKMCVLLVYNNKKDTHVQNNIAINKKGLILRYDKVNSDKSMKFVDAGAMLLKKKALEFIRQNKKASLENDLFKRLINIGELAGIKTRRRFYDIGTFKRIKEIKKILN